MSTLNDWQLAHLNRLAAIARDLGGSGSVIRDHEPSMWLREQIGQHPAATCPHRTRAVDQLTGPSLYALWDRTLRCPSCPGPRLKRGGIADRTCDRCGHVCTRERGQRIRTHTAMVGLTTVMYGLCPDCHAREVGP